MAGGARIESWPCFGTSSDRGHIAIFSQPTLSVILPLILLLPKRYSQRKAALYSPVFQSNSMQIQV